MVSEWVVLIFLVLIFGVLIFLVLLTDKGGHPDQFVCMLNFTVLDILLGIPNLGKNKDIDILNFVILFAKSYIYSSKRDEMAIDFYTFLVKLKTRMVIEEYRCNIYDKHVEIVTMCTRLADSV